MKILQGKQAVLWVMREWRMVRWERLGLGIAINV